MQSSDLQESTLRRRTANHQDGGPDPSAGSPAGSSADGSGASEEPESPAPVLGDDGNVYYNGRMYNGTGRLPRDAPFTPTYINAYTFNSVVAFISLIVTGTFFYFKIIAGILESPQVGPDREFLFTSSMGPADMGVPRPILTPNCPISGQIQDHQHQHQQSWSGSRIQDDDDCVLFGKIVVLADSISTYGHTHATYGWLGFLADEWAGRADVLLRGFPGYNTHWIKSIFPDLLQQESALPGSIPARLVLIALGTDDASFPHTRQHVAVDAFKENLKAIITLIRYPESPNYSPDTQVILVTPAPVHDAMWEASLTAANQTLDRSNLVTKEYVDACVEVGKELHVPVVNVWNDISCQVQGTCELHESSQLEDYLMDGFHLRRMGNEVLYKGIMNAVAQHYPRLHPTCWPTVFPGYSSESSPEMSVLKRHCNRGVH
ncbi:MAG: SGNH hydrolase-type esterase domain-containing protein [Benniella sp.]|nr:MAG: SGNH hydrolase-type esterase domain-containing protein [Benniella sp.]